MQAAPHHDRFSPHLQLLFIISCSVVSVNALDVNFRGQLFIQSTSYHLPPYRVPQLPSDPKAPRNIHLAFGKTEADLTVTWSTLVSGAPSQLIYRRIDSDPHPGPWLAANGSEFKFVDGGSLKATQFIHRVELIGLSPCGRYEYAVGCSSPHAGTSCCPDVMQFRVPGGSGSCVNASSRSFAIFGDLGLVNAQSVPRLLDDAVARRRFDAILHVGDFAYDMPDENGSVGDRFMQMMQPIAGQVQYMTCVGNHEEKYNFSHYKARFSMPGWQWSQSLFYSVNIGPVHLVSISNEFYFFTNYGTAQIARQYSWLEADLKAANQNRSAAPWIILIGHRPMYCSNIEVWDCVWGAGTLRNGIQGRWGLEPLMLRYGVDLAFWGHEHSFERTWPVANGKVVPTNGSSATLYLNPRAPIHVITGSAGNKEKHASFAEIPPPFTAFRSTDYGYTRVTFANSSYAYLEQVSDDRGGQVIDRFTVLQTRHGPFY